ncbi:MAG: hypothetical protein KDA51_03640, partial [Planctomycetales bacterium]|nr:hypothetical protein [Planctomycetales bacterium]
GNAVGQVQDFGSVNVQQVRFNSTLSPAPAGSAVGSALKTLNDLETSAGPIKVVVRGGNLTINDGTDGDGIGVVATGASDILLWASSNLDINAQVRSGGGHVTLQAGNDIDIDAAVSTVASGTIYVTGRDLRVNATVTTSAGDQLFTATRDLSVIATVTSSGGSIALLAGRDLQVNSTISTSTGNLRLSATQDLNVNAVLNSTEDSIGLLAGRNITQTANVTAGGDVLINAVGNFTQNSGTSTMAGLVPQVPIRDTLQVTTGGTQRLALLSAGHISLDAGGDILDNNGIDVVNLRANTLGMVAGGIIGGPGTPPPTPLNADINANALDTDVGTVAARSAQGIYLQEVASGGSLIVGNAVGQVQDFGSVNVQQVRFNSTLSPAPAGSAVGSALKTLN